MNIKVTTSHGAGMERVISTKRFYRGIQRFNAKFGANVANTARHGIANPPKSGRIYSYNGRKHRASSPNQYPANRSGLLRRNTTFQAKGLTVEVGTKDVAYAPILQQHKTAQDRTSSNGKMKARPYLTLAHDTVTQDDVTAGMISSVQSEID